MGKVYTSYFGNILKLKEKGIVPISIALFPPKWYAGEELRDLAPDVTIFSAFKENIITEERFRRFYQYKIRKMGREKIRQLIDEAAKGRDIALICFEHPDRPCHRHILGKYMGIEEF